MTTQEVFIAQTLAPLLGGLPVGQIGDAGTFESPTTYRGVINAYVSEAKVEAKRRKKKKNCGPSVLMKNGDSFTLLKFPLLVREP